MSQWISTVVTFLAAFAFGILAHRSPKRDWEFIKSWPSFALLIISIAFAQVELAQQRSERMLNQYPARNLVCEWVMNAQGTFTKECDWAVTKAGVIEPPPPFLETFADWLFGTFLSVLLDIPPEWIGVMLGIYVSKHGTGAQKPV